ncbi:MAG: hypothetical protein H6766_00315 [Candidatus Peribacteria bacterium]|nr:MAG: hypothetical protein H6766_00315 [Candidatus Peribacteria bacterium]
MGNVLAYATPQTLGYDINRAAIANNTTDPLMKGQLDNSTSAQKIERSLLVNELIGMTGQDPDTLKNSTQTFRELFDTNKV